jgi:hypothetical protein
MSGVISFSENPDEIWLVAGWAFRQIFEDISAQESDDAEMMKEFEIAEALNGLHVDKLAPSLKLRTTNSIKRTASDILAGKTRSGIHAKPYGDERTVRQYNEALRKLLAAIPESRELE